MQVNVEIVQALYFSVQFSSVQTYMVPWEEIRLAEVSKKHKHNIQEDITWKIIPPRVDGQILKYN